MSNPPTPNPSLADRLDAAAADLDASKQMAVGFNDPRSNLLRAVAARLLSANIGLWADAYSAV